MEEREYPKTLELTTNMKVNGKSWLKCVHVLILCLLYALKLTASDALPVPGQTGSNLPSAEKITSITVIPPGLEWWISIYPDGHVSAQYGQGPEDNMGMPPGAISFQRFCHLMLSAVADARPHSDTQIIFIAAGKNAFSSHYLRDDTLLRYLFPNDSSNWKSVTRFIESNKIAILPLRPRVQEILQKYPIYKAD
jgi:hypothetical protein